MSNEADRVLEKVGEAYRSLTTYSDLGILEFEKNPNSSNSHSAKLTFSTFFKRPNLFRFAWCNSDSEGVNVIWSDGRSAFSKYAQAKKANREWDLNLAIAGATGVSFGAAHNISSLLMEQITGKKLTATKNLVSQGVQLVDAQECHHLQTIDTDIFVSKSTNIILGVNENFSLKARTDADKFESFAHFSYWLGYSGLAHFMPIAALRFRRSTVYSKTLLNSVIPDSVFSEDGPAGKMRWEQSK